MRGCNGTNPQSLNRYTYALNNPCTLTDPMGLSPCDMKNATNAKVINFINANIGAVQPVASQLNLPVQDILGLAGSESAYGTSTLATSYANFFGVGGFARGGGLPAFATGRTPSISGNVYASFVPPGSTAAATGIVPSLNWFQTVYGNQVRGASSPSQFVKALTSEFNSTEAKFPSSTAGAISAIALRLDCPAVNKSTPTGSPKGGSIVPSGGSFNQWTGDWMDWLNLLLNGSPTGTVTVNQKICPPGVDCVDDSNEH